MWWSVLTYQKYMIENNNISKLKLTEGKNEVAVENSNNPLLGKEVGQ